QLYGGRSKTSPEMVERASLPVYDLRPFGTPCPVVAPPTAGCSPIRGEREPTRLDWVGCHAHSHTVEVRLHSSVEMELARELNPLAILSMQGLRQGIEAEEAQILHFQRMSLRLTADNAAIEQNRVDVPPRVAGLSAVYQPHQTQRFHRQPDFLNGLLHHVL